jgi:hypothetical protein
MRGDCGVFCGVFRALKTCHFFELYFGRFPFWEFDPAARKAVIRLRGAFGVAVVLKPAEYGPWMIGCR